MGGRFIVGFAIGCFVGSVVTKIYIDIKKEKEEKESDKSESEESTNKETKGKFWEKSSIDDYEAKKAKDMVDYSKIIDEYEYDPADSEHPTDEETLEELHEKYKNHPTKQISEEEFGTFGYDCHTVYYNEDRDEFWEEGGSPYDPDDVAMILANVPEYSGFIREGDEKIFIRNFRLQMDIVLERNDIE